MRRFVILAALLGLTACGGEMLPEETQAPASTQEAVPAQEAAPEQVREASPCSGGTTCCASYNTPATCSAVRGCFWYNNRCQPTYE
jgi:hypothetical protein